MKELNDVIKQLKIKVKYKKAGQMYGYSGFNYDADKPMGLNIEKNTIWLDQNLKGREKFKILRHEVEEMLLVRNEDYTHWEAHKKSTRRERL